jgi:hypothetical protein
MNRLVVVSSKFERNVREEVAGKRWQKRSGSNMGFTTPEPQMCRKYERYADVPLPNRHGADKQTFRRSRDAFAKISSLFCLWVSIYLAR